MGIRRWERRGSWILPDPDGREDSGVPIKIVCPVAQESDEAAVPGPKVKIVNRKGLSSSSKMAPPANHKTTWMEDGSCFSLTHRYT